MASSHHLPTLAKSLLVWHRLCDVLLFPPCLVKYGLTDAPLLMEYRFQATRVAPSTLELRSQGRPSLRSSTLPRFLLPSLSPSFPSSFVLSASLAPSFPA